MRERQLPTNYRYAHAALPTSLTRATGAHAALRQLAHALAPANYQHAPRLHQGLLTLCPQALKCICVCVCVCVCIYVYIYIPITLTAATSWQRVAPGITTLSFASLAAVSFIFAL